MTSIHFSIKGKILTTDAFSKELEYPIKNVIFLENNQKFIVLYDRDSNIRKWGQFPNIICFSSEGKKLWTAELPTTDTGDSYFQMKLNDEKLIADSICSFTCEINLDNGKIIRKIFTK